MKLNVLVLCVLFVLIVAKNVCSDQRVALVLGNGSYKSSPLNNPVNDATDIAAALKECGFEVFLEVDRDRSDMRKAVRSFGKKIKNGGVGLFYYAGHGVQVDGQNYMIPIGVDIKEKYDVEDQCLKVSYVLSAMEDAGNDMNIIILDACRDNPFRSYRSVSKGLALMDAPRGSYLAFSTKPGSVAADGIGRNGLFTSKLLRHIRTPGLNLVDVFMNVRNDVLIASNDRQEPWDNHSLRKHFYFIPESKQALQPVPKKNPKKKNIEAMQPKLEDSKIVIKEEKPDISHQGPSIEGQILAVLRESDLSGQTFQIIKNKYIGYDISTKKLKRTGRKKKHPLVYKVEDVKFSQIEAQEEFLNALEQLKKMMSANKSELKKQHRLYRKNLNTCDVRAMEVDKLVKLLKDKAKSSFTEWESEISRINDKKLKASSMKSLIEVKRMYQQLETRMNASGKKTYTTLAKLKDFELYLRHNLNAKAIGSLSGEAISIEKDIAGLIADMIVSLQESQRFINNF